MEKTADEKVTEELAIAWKKKVRFFWISAAVGFVLFFMMMALDNKIEQKHQKNLKKFIPVAQAELATAQIEVKKKEAVVREVCTIKGEACKKALVEKLEAERKLAGAKEIYQDLLNGKTLSFRFRQ